MTSPPDPDGPDTPQYAPAAGYAPAPAPGQNQPATSPYSPEALAQAASNRGPAGTVAPATGSAAGSAEAVPASAARPEPYRPPDASYGRAPIAPGGGGPGNRAARGQGNPGAGIGWTGFGLAFLLGFIGMVLGAISITRSRKAGASTLPGGLAVVVGTLQILAVIVAVLFGLINAIAGPGLRENPGDTSQEQPIPVIELAVGNCLDLSSMAESTVRQVPCATAHSGEVIHQFQESGIAFPGDDALYSRALDACYDPVASAVPRTADPTVLFVDAIVPTLAEWNNGARMVSCLLAAEGDAMTGSAAAGDLVVR